MNKTPEEIQAEAGILEPQQATMDMASVDVEGQPPQFESAFMGAMPGEPNVFTLTKALNRLAGDSMLDTDINQRASDLRRQQLEPWVDFVRAREELEAEVRAKRLEELETNRPTIGETIRAGFEVENWIGGAMASLNIPIMPPVKNYDPLVDEDLDGYWAIADQIAPLRHPHQVMVVKDNYDRQMQKREIIANASIGTGLAGIGIAVLADPLNLFMLALPAKIGAAGKVLRGATATRFGAASVGLTAIQETLLHQQQPMRTIEESQLNIMAGLLLDSMIGGAGAISRATDGTGAPAPAGSTIVPRGAGIPLLKDLRNEINEYLRSGATTDITDPFDTSVGAARVFDENVEVLKWDFKKTPVRWALGNTALFMSKITPIGSGLTANSNLARKTVADLAETNIELTGQFGRVPAETLIKVDMRRVAETKMEVIAIEEQAAKEFGMDSKTFKDEIDAAQRRGDTHENPLVQKAAQRLRKTTQDLWDRAAEQRVPGTFIEKADGSVEPIKTSTALSYQTRVYDLKKVDDDFDGFIGNIREGIEDARVRNNADVESEINVYRSSTAEEMAEASDTISQSAQSKRSKTALIKKQEREIRRNDQTIGGLKSKDRKDPRIAELNQRNKDIIASNKAMKKEITDLNKAAAAARTAITKNKAHLKELEAKSIDPYMDSELDAYAQSFYEGVVGLKDGDMHFSASARPNILKQRTNIRDEYLEDFLEKDWQKRLEQSAKSLSPRTRLAEKFGEADGDFEMTRVLEDVAEDYNGRILTLREEGDIKTANKLQKEKAKKLDNLTVVRDRLLGRVHNENRNSPMQSIGRSLMSFNAARMLNGMMISSLPEVSKMMARYGMKNFNSAVIKAAKNLKLKDLPADDAMRLSSAVYRAQGLRTAQMTDVYDITPTSSLEHGTRRLSQMTAYWSGQQGFDSLFKSAAGALSQDGLARAIKSGDVAALRKAGFNDTEIAVMSREAGMHARDVGGLQELNSDMWNYSPDDINLGFRPRELKDKIDAVIVRDADTILVQTGAGDLPKFYNSMTGRIIFQFKSFIMGATNRTLIPMLQGSNVELFKNMAYMNGLGLLSYTAYETAVGREVKWDDPEILINEMMNRGGYMGYASELMELTRRLAGKTSAGRFRGRNDVGAFLGPSFGTFKDLMRAVSLQRDAETGELLTDVDARMHAIRKLLPFQNHFLIRQMIDSLEGEAAKAMGGTGRFSGVDRGKSATQ